MARERNIRNKIKETKIRRKMNGNKIQDQQYEWERLKGRNKTK